MKTGYACWRISTWLKLGVLMTGVLMLFGCLGSLDEDADGQSGSFLVLESLIPTYIDFNTADVDVVQNECATGEEESSPEEFQGHMAAVTIKNDDLPNWDDGDPSASDVTITHYEVEYILQGDVEGAPNLDTELFYETWTILANKSMSFTAQMVPLFKKAEYVDKFGGEVGLHEVYYVASFTFVGHDAFGHRVSIGGNAVILFANFDYCNE